MRRTLTIPAGVVFFAMGVMPLFADLEKHSKSQRARNPVSGDRVHASSFANEEAGLLVVNVIGETIGKVAGFISGQNSGLQFAVVESGGTVDLRGKTILVPLEAFQFEQNGRKAIRLILDANPEKLEAAPAFDPNERIPSIEINAYWGILAQDDDAASPGTSEEGGEMPE